jgi:hypothetical protein
MGIKYQIPVTTDNRISHIMRNTFHDFKRYLVALIDR